MFINGQKIDESEYISLDVKTYSFYVETFVVPEDTVFVMGDNREDSTDSGFFKNPYIPTDDVIGKYICSIPWIFD